MSNDLKASEYSSQNADAENPENQVQVPIWNKPEPYFQFEQKDRKLMVARINPWRVAPDDKHLQTHAIAGTRGALDRVYENAIVIGSPEGTVPKYTAFVFLAFAVSISLAALSFPLFQTWSDWFIIVLSLFSCFFVFLFFVLITKLTLFTAQDQPIIFNKKDRNISFVKIASPHFFYIWRPRPTVFKTYAWDSVRIRSYKYMEGNRGVMHDSYNLCLLWGDEPSNPKLFKDWVSIGYKGWWEDRRLFQIWEHIRRYMEENGPPINPGEKLREGVYTKKWGVAMPEFPPEVIAAAGRLLSDDEVELLARTPKNKTV